MHWYDITDIEVKNDDGLVLYNGPKFLRCVYSECGRIVTHGQLEKDGEGQCACGGRKTRAAVLLTQDEKNGLMKGKYLLNEWETKMIGDDSI